MFCCRNNEIIVGIALVYIDFLHGKRILHLEDLIVTKNTAERYWFGSINKVVTHASDINAKNMLGGTNLEYKRNRFINQRADVKQDWNIVHLNEDGIKNYISKLKT